MLNGAYRLENISPTDINYTVWKRVIGDSLLQNLPGDAKVKRTKVNMEDLKLRRPINIDHKSKHIPFSRMVAIIVLICHVIIK